MWSNLIALRWAMLALGYASLQEVFAMPLLSLFFIGAFPYLSLAYLLLKKLRSMASKLNISSFR